jgi:hypothetical protein
MHRNHSLRCRSPRCCLPRHRHSRCLLDPAAAVLDQAQAHGPRRRRPSRISCLQHWLRARRVSRCSRWRRPNRCARRRRPSRPTSSIPLLSPMRHRRVLERTCQCLPPCCKATSLPMTTTARHRSSPCTDTMPLLPQVIHTMGSPAATRMQATHRPTRCMRVRAPRFPPRALAPLQVTVTRTAAVVRARLTTATRTRHPPPRTKCCPL